MEKLDQELKEIFTKEEKIPKKFSNMIRDTMENQKDTPKKHVEYGKWLKVAAVFMVIVLLGASMPTIYAQIKWNIEYKEFENRPVEYGSASIKQAMEQGYEKNIDMEYVY